MIFGMIYKNGALLPSDEIQSDELSEYLINGHEYAVEIKLKRSGPNHRRYFRFIKQAFDMQDFYENPEVFRKIIEMKAGHYTSVITHKGDVVYIPKSISWHELTDEQEFQKLFSQCINAFLAFYNEKIGTLSPQQFNTILEYS